MREADTGKHRGHREDEHRQRQHRGDPEPARHVAKLGIVFRASLRDLEQPYGDASGKRESAELLKRLRDANLSIFEPDPMRALAEAERKAS